jgi:DNA-binding Lrp family transcriptional regulator
VITAFVFVHAAPKAVASLGAAIADIDGVREVYSTTGESDLIAVLGVSDHQAIATIVTEQIAALDGVLSTRTSIAYRAYSTADRNLI